MKAIKFLTVASIALGTFGALAASARADNIVTNQWYTTGFGAVGSPLSGPPVFLEGSDPTAIDAPVAPFTITLTGSATLEVIDLEASGDSFQLFDNAISIGDTSVPVTGAPFDNADIDLALANPDFSRGFFPLAAGAHSITGIVLPGSFGTGDAAFIVTDASVPEPASLGLLTLGALTLLTRRRRPITA